MYIYVCVLILETPLDHSIQSNATYTYIYICSFIYIRMCVCMHMTGLESFCSNSLSLYRGRSLRVSLYVYARSISLLIAHVGACHQWHQSRDEMASFPSIRLHVRK